VSTITATIARPEPAVSLDGDGDGPAAPRLPARPGSFRRYLRETSLLVGRSMRTIPRVPERLLDVTLQPIMFTLLFLYVFGSAIDVPGMRYQDYLLPGLLGQGLAFGVMGAGAATATDFSSGVIDRFRSLPVTRLSVISAQVVSQMLEQILGMALIIGLGLALGWRPDLDAWALVQLSGLLLLGLFAFTWFGVLLGMLVRSSDAVQGLGFGILFPLAFLAGTFVPIEGMALIPRAIAQWDPISALVAAVRELCQGTQSHGSWQLEHPVAAMVGWCVLLIAVCVPVALRRFARSGSR
jgi:ABC-2 type transport system permease protein